MSATTARGSIASRYPAISGAVQRVFTVTATAPDSQQAKYHSK